MTKKFFLFVSPAYEATDAHQQFKGNFDSLEDAQAAYDLSDKYSGGEIATIDETGNLVFVCSASDDGWVPYSS